MNPQIVRYRNTQLETLAPVLCLSTFSSMLRGTDVMAYGDNKAALAAMAKGYSKSEFLCAIVGEFWLLAQAIDVFIWFDWIPSDRNPADPLSRPQEKPGLNFARDRGWTRAQAVSPNPA